MAEKILDSLQSQGLLPDSLREKLSQIVPDEAKEKMMGFFQKYQELDEAEQEEVFNSVLGKLKESLREEIQSSSSVYSHLLYTHSFIIFFFSVLLISFILVFFVYKLFKCLKEREIKREEKKKNKQLKKKK